LLHFGEKFEADGGAVGASRGQGDRVARGERGWKEPEREGEKECIVWRE